MITVQKEGVILEKSNLSFENHGVLNPAVIQEGDNVHLYYRAVGQGDRSTIGYCRLDGPMKVVERWDKPLMIPEIEFESFGLEDPRIVKIDELYYLSYTGFDGINARAALAVSKDLLHFKKIGILAPPITHADFVSGVKTNDNISGRYFRNQSYYLQESLTSKPLMLWDKDVVFFPKRINGQLTFLHCIRPGIQIVKIDSLKQLTKEFWDDYFLHLEDHVIMEPLYDHEASYIGSGCPPIETPYGWLFIYHGADETANGFEYSACAAALLDLRNPGRIVARLPVALFKPEYIWEKQGELNNVVFPTGTALFGNTLYIYYGAAGERIAVASVDMPELLNELVSQW